MEEPRHIEEMNPTPPVLRQAPRQRALSNAAYVALLQDKYTDDELRRTVRFLQSKDAVSSDELRVISMMRKAIKNR